MEGVKLQTSNKREKKIERTTPCKKVKKYNGEQKSHSSCIFIFLCLGKKHDEKCSSTN